jgi:hypothetical protein
MANYRLLGIKSLEKFFGAVDFNPLSTNPARLQPKLLFLGCNLKVKKY